MGVTRGECDVNSLGGGGGELFYFGVGFQDGHDIQGTRNSCQGEVYIYMLSRDRHVGRLRGSDDLRVIRGDSRFWHVDGMS